MEAKCAVCGATGLIGSGFEMQLVQFRVTCKERRSRDDYKESKNKID